MTTAASLIEKSSFIDLDSFNPEFFDLVKPGYRIDSLLKEVAESLIAPNGEPIVDTRRLERSMASKAAQRDLFES